MSALPAGLDPVSAGRIGLWLLSRRAYKAARRRDEDRREWSGDGTLAARVGALVAPWRVGFYPGTERVLASLCGVARSTAHTWLYRRRERLGAKHARRLADALEAHAAECRALAEELIQYAQVKSRNRESGKPLKPGIPLSGNGAAPAGSLVERAALVISKNSKTSL